MASPTQWTWVWVNSRSWLWTGRPGILQSMGSQRVRHYWATELNWSRVRLFVTPWTAAYQASLSFTISQSLLQLMSIELVMLSNHLILCCPLLLLPSIFPTIRVFANESALQIRWPKFWSFSISPSNEYSGLISFRIDWFDFLAVQRTLKSLLQHYSSKKPGWLQCLNSLARPLLCILTSFLVPFPRRILMPSFFTHTLAVSFINPAKPLPQLHEAFSKNTSAPGRVQRSYYFGLPWWLSW